MRFEARELKPYAEPVPTEEFRNGEVYFAINYPDSAMIYPVIETVVFIGRNLEKGDRKRLYFQDAASYFAGRRYSSRGEDDGVSIWNCAEGQTKHIFDFERALDQLMLCSLRRGDAGL